MSFYSSPRQVGTLTSSFTLTGKSLICPAI
jgi:hypothetical protein